MKIVFAAVVSLLSLAGCASQIMQGCVFWLKLDKVSRRNWTRIPFEPGHGFWLKLDKDSSANWTHQIARG